MKLGFAAVCFGLLSATVFCEDEKDVMRSLLLDGDVKAQFTSISQIMNALAHKDSDSYNCEAYCNGVQVDNLETPSCQGVFWIGCDYKLKEVEGKSSSVCVGAFKRTNTSKKAEVDCNGIWHSHSWDTITIHGMEACSVSGYSCGGFLNVDYNLSPPTSSAEIFGAQEIKINYTCQGTERHVHAMSKEKSDDVTLQGLSTAVDDYFLNEFGIQPDYMADELKHDDEDFGRNYYKDFNCTATCAGKQIDPLAPQYCLTQFKESCSGSCHDHTFKVDQQCDGAYTGYPDAGIEACLGMYTWDFTGEDSSCKGHCTRAFALKKFEGDKVVGTLDSCHGKSFVEVKHPSKMEVAPGEKEEKEPQSPVA